MSDKNDKEIKNDTTEDPTEIKNAFNDLNLFLRFLLFYECLMLIYLVGQMFFEWKDRSPKMAAINAVLIIFTLNQISINNSKKNE